MYGVCDGHGPFGHLVSFRLVQSLPSILLQKANAGKNWEIALKEAFQEAEDDLEKFCADNNVNIEASGAAGSVLILDEQTVHVAHIGDARILVGSWNRRDQRLIHVSRDHKPDLPEEKARLEAAGNDVRELGPDNYRIYLKGENTPGLTMSRAFGDTLCKGVSREPEYHKFMMQPKDEWYAIVASDGVWEFITGDVAFEKTAKKLRLKGPRETLHFITNFSRKCWDRVCGDYCDDITAIIVQWNSNERKEKEVNHAFRVKRTGTLEGASSGAPS
jgi:serine/threonine protein phosphatase PrpC